MRRLSRTGLEEPVLGYPLTQHRLFTAVRPVNSQLAIRNSLHLHRIEKQVY